MLIVGAVSYPTPADARVRDVNLPVCSSNNGVITAGVVGVPVSDTVGRFLYPKPFPLTDIDAIGNPITGSPAALIPVVSEASRVNEIVGAPAVVYDPAVSIVTDDTPLPKFATTCAAELAPASVIVTLGAALYPLPLLVIAIAVIAPALTVTAPATASSPLKNCDPEPTVDSGNAVPAFAFDKELAILIVSSSTRIA